MTPPARTVPTRRRPSATVVVVRGAGLWATLTGLAAASAQHPVHTLAATLAVGRSAGVLVGVAAASVAWLAFDARRIRAAPSADGGPDAR